MNSIKLFEYRIGIKFDKDPLAVDQNQLLDQYCNCLDCLWFRWMAKNSPQNFTLQNCLFGATNIVKNSDKEKYVYRGYEIGFDGKVSRVLTMTMLEMV